MRAARKEAKSDGRQIQPGTLIAAEWVILVTSLAVSDYPAAKVLELYRLRRAEGARLRHGANRDRLQAVEKHHRAGNTARRMPPDRQGLGLVPPDCRSPDRGAIERFRRLSPPGLRARADHWRAFRLLIAALLAAIAPALDIATILAAAPRLRRHLHEPLRKRARQSVRLLS